MKISHRFCQSFILNTTSLNVSNYNRSQNSLGFCFSTSTSLKVSKVRTIDNEKDLLRKLFSLFISKLLTVHLTLKFSSISSKTIIYCCQSCFSQDSIRKWIDKGKLNRMTWLNWSPLGKLIYCINYADRLYVQLKIYVTNSNLNLGRLSLFR